MLHWKNSHKHKSVIAVSPAFLALLAVFAVVDRERLLMHILLAAALHECGHMAAVYLGGGEIAAFRITLFGGELRIRHPEWMSYGRELLAVLAGPGVNLLAALLLARMAASLNWERGYMIAGIHASLAVFNLLPLRPLDGGRALELLLSWLIEPIAADRAVHLISCLCLGVLLTACAALQAVLGLQLPLLLALLWFVVCWCLETGIVKTAETR